MWHLLVILLLLGLLGVSLTDIARGVLKYVCWGLAYVAFFWLISGLTRNQGLAVIFGIGAPLVIASIWFTLHWNHAHPDERIDWHGQPEHRDPR